MGITIQRGSGPNLAVRNPFDFLYITGDEFTDGSVRITRGDDGVTEVQERKLGVWLPGELRLEAGSLFLGHDVAVRAVGSHLHTFSSESNRKSLLLEVEFDDSGTALPHAHVLGPRQNRVVFSSNTIGEIVTGLFELQAASFLTAFRYKYYFKTGSIAATQPVTIALTKGHAPGGTLVFRQVMPASQWPANAEIEIVLDGAISLSEGAPLLLTISSDADFSLIGDAANGGNFFAMDFQPFSLEDVVAIPTGTDRFTFSNAGEFTIGNDGNPTISGSQGSLSTTMPTPPFPTLVPPPPQV